MIMLNPLTFLTATNLKGMAFQLPELGILTLAENKYENMKLPPFPEKRPKGRIKGIKIIQHDVIAFVSAVAENVGENGHILL